MDFYTSQRAYWSQHAAFLENLRQHKATLFQFEKLTTFQQASYQRDLVDAYDESLTSVERRGHASHREALLKEQQRHRQQLWFASLSFLLEVQFWMGGRQLQATAQFSLSERLLRTHYHFASVLEGHFCTGAVRLQALEVGFRAWHFQQADDRNRLMDAELRAWRILLGNADDERLASMRKRRYLIEEVMLCEEESRLLIERSEKIEVAKLTDRFLSEREDIRAQHQRRSTLVSEEAFQRAQFTRDEDLGRISLAGEEECCRRVVTSTAASRIARCVPDPPKLMWKPAPPTKEAPHFVVVVCCFQNSDRLTISLPNFGISFADFQNDVERATGVPVWQQQLVTLGNSCPIHACGPFVPLRDLGIERDGMQLLLHRKVSPESTASMVVSVDGDFCDWEARLPSDRRAIESRVLDDFAKASGVPRADLSLQVHRGSIVFQVCAVISRSISTIQSAVASVFPCLSGATGGVTTLMQDVANRCVQGLSDSIKGKNGTPLKLCADVKSFVGTSIEDAAMHHAWRMATMTAPSKDKLLEELRGNGVVDAMISQAMSKMEQLVSGSNSANYKQMNPMAIFAVVLHTSEAYQMINPSLRRGEFDKWPCYCYYHALGIQQIPKKKTTVYRGLDVKVELAAYREGCFVSFGSVCSASKQRQKAWNKGTLFVIDTLTGADVQPFSLHPSEAEVTLQSGALYKVIAFSEGPNFLEVKLEEHSPEISSDHLAERDRAEQQLRELRERFDGLRSELCVSEEPARAKCALPAT